MKRIDGQQYVLRLIDFETEIVDGVRGLNGSVDDGGKGERDGVFLVSGGFADRDLVEIRDRERNRQRSPVHVQTIDSGLRLFWNRHAKDGRILAA